LHVESDLLKLAVAHGRVHQCGKFISDSMQMVEILSPCPPLPLPCQLKITAGARQIINAVKCNI
jgi:hypothetical protein